MRKTELHDDLAELSLEQRQLFLLLLEQEGHDPRQFEIAQRTRQEAPLSFAQSRVWSGVELSPQLPLDNVPVGIRLRGPLDVDEMQRALANVVKRHEILRTRCVVLEGQPTQVVNAPAQFDFETRDLRDLEPAARLPEAVRQACAVARVPLDLAQGSPLRSVVFQLDHDDWLFLIVAHQFVTDGYSFRLMLQELSSCYRPSSPGEQPPALPPLPIQYGDFAVWQRESGQTAALQSQLAYWKQRLRDAPPLLKLPMDRDYPPRPSYACATEAFCLSESLSEALRKASRELGVTVFMTLLAIFQLLLHRYTRQRDVVVGTLSSQRNRSETEALIGNFSNNLLLRTTFSDELKFRQLLGRVRQDVLDAQTRQDIPFQILIESLRKDGLTAVPNFHVMFIVRESSPGQSLKLPGLSSEDLLVETGVTRLDLALDVTDDGLSSMSGKVEYKTDLFDRSTIEEMVQNLVALVEQVVADLDRVVSDFSLVVQQAQRRRHVAAGSSAERDAHSPYVAPRNAAERTLAAIWEGVFGLQQIGVEDNFFALGGNSLLALQLCGRIIEQFQVELDLRQVFDSPTIAAMARTVEQRTLAQPDRRIQRVDRSRYRLKD